MSARIIDIAKAAEVSPSAVSLALNNKSGVSGELRERIQDIAKDMGYRSVARQEGRGAAGSVKLLKIAKHGHVVNERHNAFITEYLEGIEQGAKRRNYTLEVSFFNRTPVEKIVEEELRAGGNKGAGGLIVLGTELSAHELSFFTALTRPTVFIDTCFPLTVFDCVDMDNGDGVFRSIEYFYRMGHRSIGLVKSSYETRNFKEREEGFREAMEYFSLPVQEDFIIAVDPAYEQAAGDMARFLERTGLRAGGKTPFPSAFFCMNDIIAYGCMKALREKGFAIPGDVSVIGFDDLPSSSVTDPPLTSIRVSTRQIGGRALEKLSERIEGSADGRPEKILVSGTLMVRGSVKKL
ncbi:MAG: LacI family DNA-binding transcriptional regulator [Treponema sp.]|jgi:LacI family transcriptional regulator|nr:LacI family DNA-binding transcriptional regulator [Treponema sp.]